MSVRSAFLSGLVTLVLFAVVLGLLLSETGKGSDAGFDLASAFGVVLGVAGPVVVLIGVPLGWVVSTKLGSHRPVLLHVAAWAVIGSVLGLAATEVLAQFPISPVSVLVGGIAGLCAAIGRAVAGSREFEPQGQTT